MTSSHSSIAATLQEHHEQKASVSPTHFHLSLPWGRIHGHEKLAEIVPHILSEDECASIIRVCEEQGFEQALLNIGGYRQALVTEVRKSGRCIIDDVAAAKILWERVQHADAVPETIAHGGKLWQCVGLNERFRVLKYKAGEYYHHHSDGSFVRPKGGDGALLANGEPGDMSFFTVMFYLNCPEEGGGTKFIDTSGNTPGSHVKPAPGQALIFDHTLQHEGVMVEKGVKYAIRSDVMYRCVDSHNVEVDTATSVYLPTKRTPHGYMLKC